jgi:hypothetical protein
MPVLSERLDQLSEKLGLLLGLSFIARSWEREALALPPTPGRSIYGDH